MSSAFIKLAAALPEGHDAAASALFVLGKRSLRDPVTLLHVLDDSAVRAAKRDTVAATVTAVTAAGSADSLAVHHGDSRVSVQRALAANPHTPPKTLAWLLSTASRRDDYEVMCRVAHRVSLPDLFEVVSNYRIIWGKLYYSEIAAAGVKAGEDWPQRLVDENHHGLTAAVIAECVKNDLPFDHLLANFSSGVDRILASTTVMLGYVDARVVEVVLRSDPRAFVDECARARRLPAIDAQLYAVMASTLADTPRRTVPEAMLTTFSATPSSKDLFLAALKTSSDPRSVEAALPMLPFCSPEEIHEVAVQAGSHPATRDIDLYVALPDTALPATRELACSYLSDSCIRKMLFTELAAKLTHGELAALVGPPEQAAFAAKLVFDHRVTRQLWFDEFADLLGQHLLKQVSSNSEAASYVAKRLVEALDDSVEGIVFAAKLINDGFVGSISELVATVLVMHPRQAAACDEAPEVSEGNLEQLELFA